MDLTVDVEQGIAVQEVFRRTLESDVRAIDMEAKVRNLRDQFAVHHRGIGFQVEAGFLVDPFPPDP